MFAEIMCMQRVYLSNTGHRGNKRTAYRSSRSHQIAILVGFPHKFLRNNIHNRISIADNGIQFSLKTFLHDLWKRISVHFVCLVVTDVPEHLIRILDNRRTLVRTNR